MSGVRHPPANEAADHVTATRSARSATPFRECKHYQAMPDVPRALSQGGIGFFVEEVQNIHRLLKSSNAIIHILIHPATYSSPLIRRAEMLSEG